MSAVIDKNRVLVAMSGGVDSSVALKLILDQGYDAIGVTMKLWEYRDSDGNLLYESKCCSMDAINRAKLVCEQLGVLHHTVDLQDEFHKSVIDDFVNEYFVGRTPNPCVQCNTFIKFSAGLKEADRLGAHWFATGHYANIDRSDPENPKLKKGADSKKDQSYVLWGIQKSNLPRILFPLGQLTKSDVRKIAADLNLKSAEASESQDVCFVPENDYRKFLSMYTPDKVASEQSGNFMNEKRGKLGEYSGISQYTIGQRRGLGAFGPKPHYVQKIDLENNTITLVPRERMFFNGCIVGQLNWLQNPDTVNVNSVSVRIRYNHSGVPCKITKGENDTISVDFESPQFAVTPGQSSVFYSDNTLLGGGMIKEGKLYG
ncbi:MAG: tRNA 2-thiouridine(34) synthase MnmA [Candidatus Marinimicrobia bacterium]|nr:tRNA 2-thiouridine(34) synthase MnmA [Candidatus Neomarinimicrobiota bacterium]